jgi:hypothetical protein
MPHERGPSPVLPSEFVCPVLADPNARFYRDSPATPPLPMDARLTNEQTTDSKALNHFSASAPGGSALPSDAWMPACDLVDSQERADQTAINPIKQEKTREDAQLSS